MVFRRSLINETRRCKMHGPKVSNNINIMSGPRRVEIKWLTRGSAETKIQTSLVGLLVLSSSGLVPLLLSVEIFGRYRNSILLPVLHIILLVAETTNLNLSYSVTLLQPRSSRILGGVKWTSLVAQYLHLL